MKYVMRASPLMLKADSASIQCAKILRDGGPKSLVILDGTFFMNQCESMLISACKNSDEGPPLTTEWLSRRYEMTASLRWFPRFGG